MVIISLKSLTMLAAAPGLSVRVAHEIQEWDGIMLATIIKRLRDDPGSRSHKHASETAQLSFCISHPALTHAKVPQQLENCTDTFLADAWEPSLDCQDFGVQLPH